MNVGVVRVTYEDDTGRQWAVLVPEGREDEAAMGAVVGPPDVRALGLPEPVALRLHQELFNRGLLTLRDLRGRQQELTAALQAAYRTDMAALSGLYHAATASSEGEEGG